MPTQKSGQSPDSTTDLEVHPAAETDPEAGLAAIAPDERTAQEAWLPPAVSQWLHKERTAIGICLFLVAATLAVYAQTIGFEFVSYDDDEYVYENIHVARGLTLDGLQSAFTHVHASNWHPLTTLSHMLDCSLNGLWAGGHHLTNVLLHAAGSVALFLALRRLTGATWLSALVAALFCLHPLRVESVAWVTERKDVLSGLFFALTLWSYAAYADAAKSRRGTRAAGRGAGSSADTTFPWARYLLAVVLFALGLLCKPMLVTLPFVLLLVDYWPLGRWPTMSPGAAGGTQRAGLWLILEKLPLLALAAASCVVTYLVQASSGAVEERTSLIGHVQTAVVAYVQYLRMMVWPAGLAVPYPPESKINLTMTLICGIALLAITIAAVIGSKRYGRCLLVGWLWYLGMLVPVSGIITIGNQAMADRYTYLPMIGLYIAVVWFAAAVIPLRYARFAMIAGGAVLAALAVGSIVQARHWRDSESLYRRALAVTADNFEAHSNLGAALWNKGGMQNQEEALRHFDEALRIKPEDYVSHNNIGIAMIDRKQWKTAADEFQKAIDIKRDFAVAYANLAVALVQMDRFGDAEQAAREAVRLNSDSAKGENALAVALASQGKVKEAVPHFRRAIELDSSHSDWHFKLGMALVAVGPVAEGLEECRRGLEMDPESIDQHNEMAKIYHTMGRLNDAGREWAEVLKRQPHPVAAKGFGMVLFKAGENAEAAKWLSVALAAAPGDVEARQCRGRAYLATKQPRKAIADFREVLRHSPENREALNSLAWTEATHPDAKLRNGKEAVELAEKAARQKNPIPPVLDTLAAAYAEAGRFKEAVETARKARSAAEQYKDKALVDEIDAQLKLYEAGKPYREAE